MSLLRRLEQRAYLGGAFIDAWTNPDRIPLNSEAALGAGTLPLTSTSALRHWAVWACVRRIADTISTLPVDLFAPDTTPLPLPTKLRQPSPYADSIQWRWQVIASLLLHGNAYAFIASEDRLGFPSQLDLIAPEQVHPEKDDRGAKQFRIQGQLLGADAIWHLPGPQYPGDLEGMSPIGYFARTIGLGLDAEKFGVDFFQGGAHPTAVAETDQEVNEPTAKLIKDRIYRAVRNREIAVLGKGLKLSPWQINPEESQFLETQKANALAVAEIFGVPPEEIGIATTGESVTYANREQRAQAFLDRALNPWLTRLEVALSALFPRGTYVKLNTGALLRSDLKTRAEAGKLLIESGQATPNERRALEDQLPYEGGDKFWMSAKFAPIDDERPAPDDDGEDTT